VTRGLAKDVTNHHIVGMVSYNPVDLAGQIGLTASNMWGILKHIVDSLLDLDEGTYLLLKDPAKAVLRIYRVPEGALDERPEEQGESSTGDAAENGGNP